MSATAPPAGPTAAEREARAFDAIVAESGDFDPFTARGWRTLARRFARAVAPAGPLRVLDVGCGTGRSREVYRAHCAAYVGLDLSLGALRVARAREPGGWLRADAAHLPLAAESFDLVAFSSVLHHVPDRPALLREARRVLRPGGHVFAFDPNLLHPAMLLFRHPRSPLYRAEGVSPDERPLLPSVLRRDFAAAGFSAIGQRAQSDIPYRAVAPRGLDALLPLYNAGDWLWEKSGVGRFLGTFVVTWGRRP